MPTREVLNGAAREPRRPQDTVLHGLVRENLESFIEHAKLSYAKPLPRYVVEELRAYLRCGIAAHGFSLERFSILPDGRVAYRVKNPRGPRSTHRVMTPLELLARLAALVPPPRYPLVRYHGVLAPNSPWRRFVVPKPPASACQHDCSKTHRPQAQPDPLPIDPAQVPDNHIDQTFDRITDAHWKRLESGALFSTSPRLDWATLFKRTFASDALECGRCHSRMRPLELVTDEELARTLLDRMGLPSDIPEVHPPHDPDDHSTGPPTDQLSFDDMQNLPDYSGPQ